MFFFKQKTAYELRISDWSSDVCSSDLGRVDLRAGPGDPHRGEGIRGGLLAQVGGAHPLLLHLDVLVVGTGGHSHDRRADRGGEQRVEGHPVELGVVLLLAGTEATPGVRHREGERLGDEDVLHDDVVGRSEEHTYELQSLMRISYAV